MLHTVKMRSPGVKPAEAWTPTVQRAMLPGPSAAAWNAVALKLLIVFLASLAPVMLMAALGMAGIRVAPLSVFALAFFLAASGLMFSAMGVAAARRRSEYRHGYTTVDTLSKYGEYYGTVPQLESISGIEIRAAGQTRLDRQTLSDRTALARMSGTTALPRMSPAEARSAAGVAAAVNDVQLGKAKTRTQRAVLVRTLGPEAGIARARALGLAMSAIISAAGLVPVTLIYGVVGFSISGNPYEFMPLSVVLAAVSILLRGSRILTTKATRLTEDRFGLQPHSLPKWPLVKSIVLPVAATSPSR